ncbi:MAG: hypothetical protein D3910_28145 [Candidatus Electrothrix sp. ATG2]|nr:hypothetical protein [Candidatus Electrothrix sp. ATG2]
MDVATITAATVGFLGPYLVKAGDAVAKKAGEKTIEAVGPLYQAIRKKFRGDSYAEQTLSRVEEKPKSEARMAALQGVLNEKVENDQDFTKLLEQLIEQIKGADGKISGNTVKGDNNVIQSVTANGGSISGVTQSVGNKS